MPNTIMAANVLRSIVKNRDSHNQGYWIDFDAMGYLAGSEGLVTVDLDTLNSQDDEMCGTTACAAGWAMLHDGWEFFRGTLDSGDFVSLGAKKGSVVHRVPNFQEIGSQILGLTERQSDTLFLSASDDQAIAILYRIATTGEFPDDIIVEFPEEIDILTATDEEMSEYDLRQMEWESDHEAWVREIVEQAEEDYAPKGSMA